MKHLGVVFLINIFYAINTFAATDLVLWHSYRGAEKDALEKNIASFNQSHSNINVQTLQVPHDAYPDKISAAIPRGKGPDIFIFAQDRIGDWAVNDVIQPVGFWITDDIRKRFLPITLKSLEYNGEIYGLPTAFKCTALFYNKKFIKEPPVNTDDFISLAKANTQIENKQFGLVYENGLTYYNALWFYGFGGGFFDEQRNPVIDRPENIEALIFIRDLHRKHHILPEEISNSLVTTLFNDNKAAMVISGPWFRAEIAKDIDYGIATLPVISKNNQPSKPFLTVEAFMMSSKTEHPLESFEVINALTQAPYTTVMAIEGKQPAANADTYNETEVKSDPWLEIFKQQLDNSVPMPNFPEMRMIWTPMDIAISKVLNKNADPSAALKEAQQKIQENIQIFRK
ncbi:extracellular solute-binding protein [bacterium]|nr:extracellular solute-binding protein [candidate division CSSED10-310 bacterium]